MPTAAFVANQTHYAPASQPWFFDSGASNHITNNLQNISQPQLSVQPEGILVGNGSALPVTHSGSGQALSENFVSRSLSQGLVSYPDLL